MNDSLSGMAIKLNYTMCDSCSHIGMETIDLLSDLTKIYLCSDLVLFL